MNDLAARWRAFLTDHRRTLFGDTFVGAVALVLGIAATLWIVVAFIVGSWETLRWIGSLF